MKAICFSLLIAGAVLLPPARAAEPVFQSVAGAEFDFGGFIGSRLHANLENWELRVPDANPALLEMFYDRERKPDRRLLPWSGEFVGKFLCLHPQLSHFARPAAERKRYQRAAFMESQGADGYLGPFDRQNRLTGENWESGGTTGRSARCCSTTRVCLAGGSSKPPREPRICWSTRFSARNIHLTNDGSFGQMNYAVIHAFTKLYRMTKIPVTWKWPIGCREWDHPGAGL